MTLHLEITRKLERQLKQTARQMGLGPEQCALRLLEDRLDNTSQPAQTELDADPLMAMAGVDDFEPAPVDKIVYR